MHAVPTAPNAFFAAYQAAAADADNTALSPAERAAADSAVHDALSGLVTCGYALTPDASGIVPAREAEFV